jgi:hypothetical protein
MFSFLQSTEYFYGAGWFDKGKPEVVDQIATEAFLRGCRDKEAARSVLEKDPSSITQAVKMVKTYIANQRAIFGVRTSHSYAHRQVSFFYTIYILYMYASSKTHNL